jgi:Asp-tRNA(Asn)/Glu-tRNA(Gln) amidotransferase A subunit family amidase
MLKEDLAWTPAWKLRELIISAELSPVELIDACLARIEAVEPELHSLVTVAAERARTQAHEAAAAVARREPLGPLHGVPVAVKDELWTQDIASTGGSLLFSRFVPKRDGTVAERLRAAGAIIVAKSALPEFATWPRTKTRLGPETVNPWDHRRIPGASSGGSAAAVAAGLFPVAIGSDGGGSIRIPSALCGSHGPGTSAA